MMGIVERTPCEMDDAAERVEARHAPLLIDERPAVLRARESEEEALRTDELPLRLAPLEAPDLPRAVAVFDVAVRQRSQAAEDRRLHPLPRSVPPTVSER